MLSSYCVFLGYVHLHCTYVHCSYAQFSGPSSYSEGVYNLGQKLVLVSSLNSLLNHRLHNHRERQSHPWEAGEESLERGVSTALTTDISGWMILGGGGVEAGGAVLCLVGCSAASLASTLDASKACPSPARRLDVTIKSVSRHCSVYPGRQYHPCWRPSHWVRILQQWLPSCC